MPKPTGGRHFDAEAMRREQLEPTIQIGGLLYVGRLFSAPEWLYWNERLQQLRARMEAGEVRDVEILVFYREYFRAIFPRKRYRFWWPDAADELLKEPLAVIEEAFERFFERQARANGAELLPRTATRPPTTDGRSSSDSTLAAAVAAEG